MCFDVNLISGDVQITPDCFCSVCGKVRCDPIQRESSYVLCSSCNKAENGVCACEKHRLPSRLFREAGAHLMLNLNRLSVVWAYTKYGCDRKGYPNEGTKEYIRSCRFATNGSKGFRDNYNHQHEIKSLEQEIATLRHQLQCQINAGPSQPISRPPSHDTALLDKEREEERIRIAVMQQGIVDYQKTKLENLLQHTSKLDIQLKVYLVAEKDDAKSETRRAVKQHGQSNF